jgi:hypothetical protein
MRLVADVLALRIRLTDSHVDSDGDSDGGGTLSSAIAFSFVAGS